MQKLGKAATMYIKYTICIYFGLVLLIEGKATETQTTELKRLLEHFLKSSKRTIQKLVSKKTAFQIPVIRQPFISQRKHHWRRFAAYASSFDQLHKMSLNQAKGRMRSPLVNQVDRDVQLMTHAVRRMKDHMPSSSSVISKPIFKTTSRDIKTSDGTPSPLRKVYLEYYDILTKITDDLLDERSN